MTNKNSKADKKAGGEDTTGIRSKLGPIPDEAFENDAVSEPRPELKPTPEFLAGISKIGR